MGNVQSYHKNGLTLFKSQGDRGIPFAGSVNLLGPPGHHKWAKNVQETVYCNRSNQKQRKTLFKSKEDKGIPSMGR